MDRSTRLIRIPAYYVGRGIAANTKRISQSQGMLTPNKFTKQNGGKNKIIKAISKIKPQNDKPELILLQFYTTPTGQSQ